MTIDLDRYLQLKRRVDQLQRDTDRAEGALAQLMNQLKDEFGCGTLDDAQKLLGKLKKKAEAAEKSYQTALQEFEEDWGEILGSASTTHF